jgi:pSer/pThr/pTyr-binding forkhead associated (FHA) protein
MLSQIILTITSGKFADRNFIFNEIITTIIGRADDCHPKLPNDEEHSTISRYHAYLISTRQTSGCETMEA